MYFADHSTKVTFDIIPDCDSIPHSQVKKDHFQICTQSMICYYLLVCCVHWEHDVVNEIRRSKISIRNTFINHEDDRYVTNKNRRFFIDCTTTTTIYTKTME